MGENEFLLRKFTTNPTTNKYANQQERGGVNDKRPKLKCFILQFIMIILQFFKLFASNIALFFDKKK